MSNKIFDTKKSGNAKKVRSRLKTCVIALVCLTFVTAAALGSYMLLKPLSTSFTRFLPPTSKLSQPIKTAALENSKPSQTSVSFSPSSKGNSKHASSQMKKESQSKSKLLTKHGKSKRSKHLAKNKISHKKYGKHLSKHTKKKHGIKLAKHSKKHSTKKQAKRIKTPKNYDIKTASK